MSKNNRDLARVGRGINPSVTASQLVAKLGFNHADPSQCPVEILYGMWDSLFRHSTNVGVERLLRSVPKRVAPTPSPAPSAPCGSSDSNKRPRFKLILEELEKMMASCAMEDPDIVMGNTTLVPPPSGDKNDANAISIELGEEDSSRSLETASRSSDEDFINDSFDSDDQDSIIFSEVSLCGATTRCNQDVCKSTSEQDP
jgi:hypothetical protein